MAFSSTCLSAILIWYILVAFKIVMGDFKFFAEITYLLWRMDAAVCLLVQDCYCWLDCSLLLPLLKAVTPLCRIPKYKVLVITWSPAIATGATSGASGTDRTNEIVPTGRFETHLAETVPLVQFVPQLGLRRQGMGMFTMFYTWVSVRLERGHWSVDIASRHDFFLDWVQGFRKPWLPTAAVCLELGQSCG